MNAKKSRSNKKQIKVLVDFMATHNHLATGEFTGPLGAKRADSQWQILKSLLAEHGPDRSAEQWKQTWKDLKKHARSENAAAARAHNATGNKDAIPIVSDIGTKILDTIGHECSTGVGPAESPIGDINEIVEISVVEADIHNFEQPSTSHCVPLPPPSNTINILSPPTGFVDQENIPPLTTTTTTRTNPRAKARPHAEHFARLQEESNSILQVIASSLTDKNNLMREHNILISEQNAHLAEGNRLKRMKRFSRRFSFS